MREKHLNTRIKQRGKLRRAVRTFRGYSRRKKILLIAVTGLVAMLLTSLLTFAFFARDISDRERLMNRNNTGIRLLDKDGESYYVTGRVKTENDIKLDAISDHMEKALIASEDKNFYEHSGYSLPSIVGAMLANVLNKDATRYGGSTITQQLVKNNLLTNNKSFLRKYQELSIAIAVDRNYSKDDILEMYLNSVYYGENAFGIGPAARTYFNKTPQELTLAESSMLVGLLPAPSAYSPVSGDAALAKQQQQGVLDKMFDLGYINSEESAIALQQPLVYNQTPPAASNDQAEHFAEMVIAELNERYGEERVARSGFQVTTSLDLDWQRIAEEQVQARVRQLSGQGGRNSSVVAIDPRSGAIRALVGSVDWDNAEFGKVNMALANRQPGSSFKPIYYTEAMARQLITPATILHDTPKAFGTYKPQNYDFKFMGDMTTRRALAQSRNLTSIEVMEKLGINNSIEAAKRIGIDTVTGSAEQYGLALALGTAEANLLDMTNAYAAYANGGKQFAPVTIMSIQDKFGKTTYENDVEEREVQTPEASYLISSILSDQQARAPTFNSLNITGRTVAVKTGTTDNNRDAWTIGYTPSIAVGVWLGNNENEPMSGVAGASGAGPIWRGVMQRILTGTTTESFAQPVNVAKVEICSANGRRADRSGPGTYAEYFIIGTAPRDSCNVPRPTPPPPAPTPPPATVEPDEDEDDETTPTPVTPPATVVTQCNDGRDNDGDGRTDLLDPGCSSATDNSEFNTAVTPPTPGPAPTPTPGTPTPTPGTPTPPPATP